jgi:uncharacterized protein YndB with AHSA1/START domain
MHAFTVTELIRAPVEEVWEIAGDPTRFPEWMRGLGTVGLPDDGLLEGGAELPVAVTERGQTRHATMRLAQWEPPHGFALQAGGPQAGTLYRYRFEPTREGAATRATLEAEIRISGKWFLLAWLLKRGMKRSDGGQLKALGFLVTGK